MILDNIIEPRDLKGLSSGERVQLCAELREFIQGRSKAKAGHIKSSLGVTELTVALHSVLNTPDDILIWDVGHQAYVHKVLTNRREQFNSNRQKGGLSGFTRRAESEYDPFGAGHSSTSVSALLGFAEADLLRAKQRQRVAVIGDGAFTGGMNFEALNYLGERQLDVLIVLNDNHSSIDENVGALHRHQRYRQFCESLAIQYFKGPDGHDVNGLIVELDRLSHISGPKLLHIETEKGRGFQPAGSSSPEPVESFQSAFGAEIVRLGHEIPELVVISPAMISGGAMQDFKEQFPSRIFDVGIAEQHAVTMAAGMAAAGLRPLVHLYSTFSQRAIDQIIHDVALQKLPVTLVLDRAGLVGEDGATHHGVFDISLFNAIPEMELGAAYDGNSLCSLLRRALTGSGPFTLRYPKAAIARNFNKDEIAQMSDGKEKAILSFGAIAWQSWQALQGLPYAHFLFDQLKPLDEERIKAIAVSFDEIITVEENSLSGGFGASVSQVLRRNQLSNKLQCLGLADQFIQHGSREELLKDSGLDASALRTAFLRTQG